MLLVFDYFSGKEDHICQCIPKALNYASKGISNINLTGNLKIAMIMIIIGILPLERPR